MSAKRRYLPLFIGRPPTPTSPHINNSVGQCPLRRRLDVSGPQENKVRNNLPPASANKPLHSPYHCKNSKKFKLDANLCATYIICRKKGSGILQSYNFSKSTIITLSVKVLKPAIFIFTGYFSLLLALIFLVYFPCFCLKSFTSYFSPFTVFVDYF